MAGGHQDGFERFARGLTVRHPELSVGHNDVFLCHQVREVEKPFNVSRTIAHACPLYSGPPANADAVYADVREPQSPKADQETRVCLGAAACHYDRSEVDVPVGRLK